MQSFIFIEEMNFQPRKAITFKHSHKFKKKKLNRVKEKMNKFE